MQKNRNVEIPGSLPDCRSVRNFLKGFHTEATKETYSKKLSYFLDYTGMTPAGCCLLQKDRHAKCRTS